MLKNSINCVIACWAGNRRGRDDKYIVDRTHYLKTQLKSLLKYKHSLSQITFVISSDLEESDCFTKYVNSLPKIIQNTKVVVLRKQNKGQSYGAFSHVYALYRKAFDYYIFIEDDYIFITDDFDTELVRMLKEKNCGYLSSLVSPSSPVSLTGPFAHMAGTPHAAIANGIAKSEILEKIWKTHGELPHQEQTGHYCGLAQMSFSWAFLDVGSTLSDYTDWYRSPFSHLGQLIFYGNQNLKDIIIPVQFTEQLVEDL